VRPRAVTFSLTDTPRHHRDDRDGVGSFGSAPEAQRTLYLGRVGRMGNAEVRPLAVCMQASLSMFLACLFCYLSPADRVGQPDQARWRMGRGRRRYAFLPLRLHARVFLLDSLLSCCTVRCFAFVRFHRRTSAEFAKARLSSLHFGCL